MDVSWCTFPPIAVNSLVVKLNFLKGGGSTLSNPNPPHQRKELAMISALIEHPTEGCLLYETGSGKDYPEVWGAPINDIFGMTSRYPQYL